MKDSKLFKKATSENWLKIFNLQDWVGGRTSITSSVGLLPLALINEDITEFIRGASLMDEATRISDFKNKKAVGHYETNPFTYKFKIGKFFTDIILPVSTFGSIIFAVHPYSIDEL